MAENRSFSAKSNSTSVMSAGKLPQRRPKAVDLEKNFAANVVLRPAWMKAEHEDAYLLGMLLTAIKDPNGGPMKTRSELCKAVFDREVISDDEEKKLNRAMWELHRLGIIQLHNLEVN